MYWGDSNSWLLLHPSEVGYDRRRRPTQSHQIQCSASVSRADFRLWIQRVELYFREADVPRDKRGQELASLLDDEPFRIVCQMGLLRVDSGIDYAEVKECLEKQFAPSGLQLEWQRKFHTGQQEQAESLIEFTARLRMLVDKAYPSWPAEERLELVRNQFIHAWHSFLLYPA